MATQLQQKKLRELFDHSMANGGRKAFRENWERCCGICSREKPVMDANGEWTGVRHEQYYDPAKDQFRDEKRTKHEQDASGAWQLGEAMSALNGPNWKTNLEQFWQPAAAARFEGVGGAIMAGDTPYVSAGIDVIAGLMNARALARNADPEWIWDRMCNVQEASGEGGFHIGKRILPDNKPFNDLADGQMLPTSEITSTRIHRNRTLNQGRRAKVNYWAIRDDLTGQIMETVDQFGELVLAERERKVADAVLGISKGSGAANTFATTVSSGTSIGTDNLAIPVIQDGLTFYPYQKGTYGASGANVNAVTASPENQLAIANYGNCNDTDSAGLTDYTAILRAIQTLALNRDPFTGLPINVNFNNMQFFCAPGAETQVKFLLEAQALWQIANSGLSTTGGTNTVSTYNLVRDKNLQIITSQFWANRLVDVGVAKVAANGTYSQLALNTTTGYGTTASVYSCFYLGHFQEAVTYWQRMPYTVVQSPLSSVEYGEQTVIVQDHRERGQAFWINPRVVWRAFA